MSANVGVSSVSISHLPPVSITNGIIRPSALLSRERNTEVTRIAVEAQRLARGSARTNRRWQREPSLSNSGCSSVGREYSHPHSNGWVS